VRPSSPVQVATEFVAAALAQQADVLLKQGFAHDPGIKLAQRSVPGVGAVLLSQCGIAQVHANRGCQRLGVANRHQQAGLSVAYRIDASRIRVAITGSSIAAASKSDAGKPSRYVGRTRRSRER
jgi:hypothetical protein